MNLFIFLKKIEKNDDYGINKQIKNIFEIIIFLNLLNLISVAKSKIIFI